MVFMQLPQWLARFNRHFTNPIQSLWAGWAPTFGILEHVGRKSGKPYRTPLTVFPLTTEWLFYSRTGRTGTGSRTSCRLEAGGCAATARRSS